MKNGWDDLTALIPEAKSLPPAERKALSGWVRRSIWLELEEEEESRNIFAAGDIPALAAFIRALPMHTPEDINAFAADLNLTAEEAELEAANWPYRHQSARGQLLIGQELVGFTLIRLKQHAYLLLSRLENSCMVESISLAIGQTPSAHSKQAFRLADRTTWFAWAFFVDPDPVQARMETERLRELWDAMEEA